MVHMKCYIGMLKGLVLKVLIPTSSVCFFQMYFFLFTYASEATEHIIKIWVVYNGWIYCVVFAVSWINSLFNLSMLTLYWAESPVRYLLKKKIQCGPVGEFLYLTVFTIIHYIKHITHIFPAHRYLMVKNTYHFPFLWSTNATWTIMAMFMDWKVLSHGNKFKRQSLHATVHQIIGYCVICWSQA